MMCARLLGGGEGLWWRWSALTYLHIYICGMQMYGEEEAA